MVYMFLANGFEETEAIAPLDILRRAGIDIMTVAVGDAAQSRTVTGAHGVPFVADISESDVDSGSIEMVILPGGLPGADNLFESECVKAAIEAADKKGAYLAAICAAPYILGVRGYLNGKSATCYPGYEDKLLGAHKSDAPVVTDGTVITAEAMGAAIPFGLALVAALRGKETADKIASAIRYR